MVCQGHQSWGVERGRGSRPPRFWARVLLVGHRGVVVGVVDWS